MLEFKFTKMHGCGNDYIYFNCFNQDISSPESLAVKLSDRHFGIGGDGIVLIYPSDKADAKMRMFNIDGSEGKMCGNAIRCVGKYLFDNKMVDKKDITIDTLSGTKSLKLYTQDDVVISARVDMGKAELNPINIPVKLDGNNIINRETNIDGQNYNITCVSMGNPHCIIFCDDVDTIDTSKLGPEFEHSSIFPERVNTEFVRIINRNTIKMRVWERGSGETLACGTGACASAVSAVLNGYCNKGEDIKVILVGGELVINYTEDTVFMTGSAQKVFEGVVTV